MQFAMPVWAQWIVGISVLIGAVAVIWRTLLRPLGKMIHYMGDMLPLLSDLTEQFKNSPDSFSVLQEIAAQFRTDSGTTLRDIVNRLLAAAEKQEAAASTLRSNAQVLEEKVEAVRLLAREDRQEATNRLKLLDAVLVKLSDAEEHVKQVADDLAKKS